MKSLTLIFTFFIVAAFTNATPSLVSRSQLQMNQYSMLNHTQQQINETELVRGSGRCNYKIDIKTSCSSPEHTTDTIDIIIGDANGNQIISSPDPSMRGSSLKRCTTNPFDMGQANCIGKICSMFFVRFGTDGWIPESATLYNDGYPPITFNFNYLIPFGVPSGIYNCNK